MAVTWCSTSVAAASGMTGVWGTFPAAEILASLLAVFLSYRPMPPVARATLAAP